MYLTERMLQPATSAIWAAVSDLLTIISWISWRCEAVRFGAMFRLAAQSDVCERFDTFPNGERLRPASFWQLCAPDKPFQVPIHKSPLHLLLT
jgi:hypothetical protein